MVVLFGLSAHTIFTFFKYEEDISRNITINLNYLNTFLDLKHLKNQTSEEQSW